MPFDQIAPTVDRSPAATRQLASRARAAQSALLNGAPGLVWAPAGRPRVAFAFTLEHAKIVAIDLIADPERLAQLDLVLLAG